jgi:hypothetical protein
MLRDALIIEKKINIVRNRDRTGVFERNFGNGAVGDIDSADIIGLLRFWAKNEGKNIPKSTRNPRKSTGFERKSTKSKNF